MGSIDTIAIYFSINKYETLDKQVDLALKSWNKKNETRDYIPEFLVLSLEDKDKYQDVIIRDLNVLFRKDVQKNHFKIEGKIF